MTEREYHRDGFIIGKDGQKIIRREKIRGVRNKTCV